MKEVRQLNDVHGNIQFGEIDEAKRRRALFQVRLKLRTPTYCTLDATYFCEMQGTW